MTFSIAAYDPDEGAWGVAVASKFLAVGAMVPWVRAGAGAVATQSYAKISFGPDGLGMMASGISAEETLQRLLESDPGQATRQVGIVDADGRAAAHTGVKCNEWAGHRIGVGFCCQGNILTGPEVLEAMATAFLSTEGELADRLLAALLAGDRAGGDRRGRQGAALYVAKTMAATVAIMIAISTCASTTIPIRSRGWNGWSRCITSILAKRARKTACRSPRNWCANSN